MSSKRPKKTGTKTKADLDFEIGFFERIVERDPEYVEALEILGDAYTKTGAHEKGLRIDERLTQLRPQDATAHYNLACSLALLSRRDEAIASLERAVERGYSDALWMTKDSDLDSVRGDHRFKKLLEKIVTRHSSQNNS